MNGDFSVQQLFAVYLAPGNTLTQQIDPQKLQALLESEHIDDLELDELARLFREEKGITDFLPDGIYETDPRNGERIVFNSARTRRPHDNRPSSSKDRQPEKPCLICQGRTTSIVDLALLSEGFTFINKNLFPAFYPFENESIQWENADKKNENMPDSGRSVGMHFLQWTSSLHDSDWHNLPLPDGIVVMDRLAALERKLLSGFASLSKEPGVEEIVVSNKEAYVLIIKNFGRLVGGSLEHGHQQIILSNIMPKRFEDDWTFFKRKGETFSQFMLRTNPAELLLKDYGPAILLIPYFMRRPYNMMLIVKDSTKRYLHHLKGQEISAVAAGWGDAILAIRQLMPEISRETAYNVVTHNGPGAGLYFEFLPYTQERGGFEQLGLVLCQANPGAVASHVRDILG